MLGQGSSLHCEALIKKDEIDDELYLCTPVTFSSFARLVDTVRAIGTVNSPGVCPDKTSFPAALGI